MKSTDFLNEHNAFIAQDADAMHKDQEVQMARADLYNAADYAIKLHKILRGVNDTADMEQWVMEKIAIANENLRTVYEYLNYENKEQEMLPMPTAGMMESRFNELVAEGSIDFDQIRRDADASLKKNIDSQSDARIAALRNPPKEKSFLQKVGDKQIGMVKGAVRGAIKGFKGQPVEESASIGASTASGFSTGPVGAAAPMQRRVKKESTRYANAVKTKQPKLGKGVY